MSSSCTVVLTSSPAWKHCLTSLALARRVTTVFWLALSSVMVTRTATRTGVQVGTETVYQYFLVATREQEFAFSCCRRRSTVMWMISLGMDRFPEVVFGGIVRR